MKAAVFHDQRDLRVDDVPEPETSPGGVKIEVGWCGICGSDLHEYLAGPISFHRRVVRIPSRVKSCP
jgi:(R,R)-butanediol dehydrogenase / meso-butanediol dehydrogenase / diacetyl reductase